MFGHRTIGQLSLSSSLFIANIIIILIFLVPRLFGHHVVTQISLYYETLCPDSRNFFRNQLYPTYEKLNRYMDVELVPFGNANVSYPRHDNKPVFRCQHGPKECYGNRVQSCTIEMLKNTDLSIRFVHCMFDQKDWLETSQTSRRCAEQMQLDWPKISSCADGSEGERLLIANSLKTFNLNPEHTYVPWIVIDKNHTAQMQTNAETNLLGYLCEHNFNHEPQIDQCSKEAISLSQHLHNNSIKPKATLTIISIMTATTIILMSLIFG
uniref:Gamma-interferon-inducible lysosomal thiol reductase-like n=1 Tax=Dermatophagoides pteronyssinus TaxID=6956 RepID=A0A6P6YJ14_DERPT|nr:gamma-interferon-inducible lysosomal thiol reductase-like [Dermatophagoides pteronyssinus]